MEGAVMQSRTFRDVSYFDRSVNQLRKHFDLLVAAAAGGEKTRKRKATKSKRGGRRG